MNAQNFTNMNTSITKQSSSSQKHNAQIALQKEQQFFGTPRESPQDEEEKLQPFNENEDSYDEVDMDIGKNCRD